MDMALMDLGGGVGIFGTLLIGGVAGWIAEKLTGSDHGLLTNIVIGMVHVVVDFGRSQQRLGRNTAPVQADTAKVFAFDHSNLHAQLRRPDRSDISSGPCAYDDHVETCFTHTLRSFTINSHSAEPVRSGSIATRGRRAVT